MDSLATRFGATDALGPFGLGLQLFEQPFKIHISHDTGGCPRMGNKTNVSNVLCLRHWPDRIWCIYDPNQTMEGGTDISHGQVILRLRGSGALTFLTDYTPVDLCREPICAAGTVRSHIGRMPVVMWWDITSDIHIAIERSYAQSLVNLLREYIKRRTTEEHQD